MKPAHFDPHHRAAFKIQPPVPHIFIGVFDHRTDAGVHVDLEQAAPVFTVHHHQDVVRVVHQQAADVAEIPCVVEFVLTVLLEHPHQVLAVAIDGEQAMPQPAPVGARQSHLRNCLCLPHLDPKQQALFGFPQHNGDARLVAFADFPAADFREPLAAAIRGVEHYDEVVVEMPHHRRDVPAGGRHGRTRHTFLGKQVTESDR